MTTRGKKQQEKPEGLSSSGGISQTGYRSSVTQRVFGAGGFPRHRLCSAPPGTATKGLFFPVWDLSTDFLRLAEDKRTPAKTIRRIIFKAKS
jgi:hypothetical protein